MKLQIKWNNQEKVLAPGEYEDFVLLEKKETIENGFLWEYIIAPKKEIHLIDFQVFEEKSYKKTDSFYLNGYQSWTDTGYHSFKEPLKSLKGLPKGLVKKYAFSAYGDEIFYPYHKNELHSYTVFYDTKNQMFYGSINDSFVFTRFSVVKNSFSIQADLDELILCEPTTILKFIARKGTIEEGFQEYKKYMPYKENIQKTGYTSWYNDYQNINEEKILQNLNHLSPSEYDIFQIDDGFETYVGDFFDIDSKKFPNGLKGIVRKIEEKNMIPGIWLAPFAAETDSKLFKENPTWFMKDKKGEFIKAGGNWSGFYCLNVELPEVQDYVKRLISFYVKDLGFKLIKLDFLYAACFSSNEYKTRAKVLRDAMTLIREAAGEDIILLGCGVPLASVMGIVDYVRIGPDVSLKYDDVWFMKFMHRERISTKITLQNTIYRSYFNTIGFCNDPDVFILRDDNNELNYYQMKSLLLINAIFGSYHMTSDDISKYEKEEQDSYLLAKRYEEANVLEIKKVSKNIIYFKIDLKGSIKEFDFYIKEGKLTERLLK